MQFSAKYWKNPIYTTNIPINISEGAIPYSHVDKMRPIEPYDGNIHTLTTELGNEVFSETTTYVVTLNHGLQIIILVLII